jgi:hypothetical protein
MSFLLPFVARHTYALVHAALGVLVVLLGSIGFATYAWVFRYSAKTECLPQALQVFELTLLLFGGLYAVLLTGAFVGKWADNATGWKRWSLISMMVSLVAYVVYMKLLIPGTF